MKVHLASKGALFPQDRRETLAKQIITADVRAAYRLAQRVNIFNTKEQAWRGLEKLLGRTRRQTDNWRREVGVATVSTLQ